MVRVLYRRAAGIIQVPQIISGVRHGPNSLSPSTSSCPLQVHCLDLT